MAAVAPGWTLEPWTFQELRDRQRVEEPLIYASGRWRNGKVTVDVTHFVFESLEVATAAYRRTVRASSIGTIPVPDLGDQACITVPFNTDGSRQVTFRRGQVLVVVSTIGESDVMRFAGVLAGAVNKVIAAGGQAARPGGS
jgi:hypothetical protein